MCNAKKLLWSLNICPKKIKKITFTFSHPLSKCVMLKSSCDHWIYATFNLILNIFDIRKTGFLNLLVCLYQGHLQQFHISISTKENETLRHLLPQYCCRKWKKKDNKTKRKRNASPCLVVHFFKPLNELFPLAMFIKCLNSPFQFPPQCVLMHVAPPSWQLAQVAGETFN